jgi:hypothetical protein
VSDALRIAVLEHDHRAASGRLATALREEGAHADRIRPGRLPDAPLRLRKIGDAPGRLPGTLMALATGGYDLAHAFTAQDAVAALAWARLGGQPVVYTQREPLSRANVADRRLRLAVLRLALERSAAVVAADEPTAASLRRWMAVEARVLSPDSGAEHLALYAELARR